MQWVHLHPQGWKIFLRRNIQGKFVRASPRQSKSQFLGHFLLGGLDLEVYLVVLDGLLRATTKKRSLTFFSKKVHPQTKSWLRLCICKMSLISFCISSNMFSILTSSLTDRSETSLVNAWFCRLWLETYWKRARWKWSSSRTVRKSGSESRTLRPRRSRSL